MFPDPLSRRFEGFGGECEIFAVGVPDRRLDDAVAWTGEQHRRFTRFEPASELSRLNAAAGRWVAIHPDLEAMLRAGLDAWWRTGGLVHIGILPSLLAAGYTRTLAAGPTGVALLDRAAIAPLPDLLEVRQGEARLAPGAAVDLGGLAKGWLADRLVAALSPNALVSFGGDLAARGAGPAGEGWPVGFGDRTVLLRDTAAATSGTTKRSWGEGLHHLIDPRTGHPADSDLVEVSVLANSALDAEVLAKAALLLGGSAAERWLADRALGWSLT